MANHAGFLFLRQFLPEDLRAAADTDIGKVLVMKFELSASSKETCQIAMPANEGKNFLQWGEVDWLKRR